MSQQCVSFKKAFNIYGPHCQKQQKSPQQIMCALRNVRSSFFLKSSFLFCLHCFPHCPRPGNVLFSIVLQSATHVSQTATDVNNLILAADHFLSASQPLLIFSFFYWKKGGGEGEKSSVNTNFIFHLRKERNFGFNRRIAFPYFNVLVVIKAKYSIPT